MNAEEIIRASMESWNERGIDGFAEYLSPDVLWHAPDYLEGGEWHGREAILQDWRQGFDSVFDHVHVQLDELEIGRNGWFTNVHGHGWARDPDIELDWHTYFAGKLDGQLITEIWVFNERADARRVAGLDAE